MPDIATHQRQAAHNRETSVYLQRAGEAHLDWAVTVIFYTALHLIDQVLYYRAQLNPRNHNQRHAAIANDPILAVIYHHYRELEHQSRRARYDCVHFTLSDLTPLRDHLARIEQVVQAAIP